MMKVAEELYQEGFISYPRTETDCFDPAYDLKVPPVAHRPAALALRSQSLHLSSRLHGPHQGAFPVYPGTGAESERYQSFGELYRKPLRPTYVATVADTSSHSLQALVRDHVQDARWGQHAQRIDSGEMWSPPRSGGHNDKAHPPIHPTRWTAGQPNWHQEKARLYEFIVRSFLAACSKPAVGFQTNIEARIGAELFTTTGKPACNLTWLEALNRHGFHPDMAYQAVTRWQHRCLVLCCGAQEDLVVFALQLGGCLGSGSSAGLAPESKHVHPTRLAARVPGPCRPHGDGAQLDGGVPLGSLGLQ